MWSILWTILRMTRSPVYLILHNIGLKVKTLTNVQNRLLKKPPKFNELINMNRMACIVVSGFQECFSVVLSAAVDNTRGNVANGSRERVDCHEQPINIMRVFTDGNWLKCLLWKQTFKAKKFKVKNYMKLQRKKCQIWMCDKQ